MIFKEKLKIKPIISFMVCLILFGVLFDRIETRMIFFVFSVYFLIQSLLYYQISISNDALIISVSFILTKSINISQIESIEQIRINSNPPTGMYLGIFYFLLDFQKEFILIKSDNKKLRIPVKYLNDDVKNTIINIKDESI